MAVADVVESISLVFERPLLATCSSSGIDDHAVALVGAPVEVINILVGVGHGSKGVFLIFANICVSIFSQEYALTFITSKYILHSLNSGCKVLKMYF